MGKKKKRPQELVERSKYDFDRAIKIHSKALKEAYATFPSKSKLGRIPENAETMVLESVYGPYVGYCTDLKLAVSVKTRLRRAEFLLEGRTKIRETVLKPILEESRLKENRSRIHFILEDINHYLKEFKKAEENASEVKQLVGSVGECVGKMDPYKAETQQIWREILDVKDFDAPLVPVKSGNGYEIFALGIHKNKTELEWTWLKNKVLDLETKEEILKEMKTTELLSASLYNKEPLFLYFKEN